jgi:glycosyltransferase involved in cell wall biosynthesis
LIAVPHLPAHAARAQADAAQRRMVNQVMAELGAPRPVLWHCTPLATGFTHQIEAAAVVYDCTRESARESGWSGELLERERWLLEHADVVFTNSHSLCRAKRKITGRRNIYPFLSGVDVTQFAQAREPLPCPPDQDEIPRPRIGYWGVIDERVDSRLLADVARARPDLQFVMVGPIVNVEPGTLPQSPNIHWLGAKPRERQSAYLAGWDVAMLPLRCSDAPLFVSPTKVGEYLASAKPVVSTRIADVIEPYGRNGLAWIADDPGDFAEAIEEALASDRPARVAHADIYLADHSWQSTWDAMWNHVERAMRSRGSSSRSVVRRSSAAVVHSLSVVQR